MLIQSCKMRRWVLKNQVSLIDLFSAMFVFSKKVSFYVYFQKEITLLQKKKTCRLKILVLIIEDLALF